MNLIDLLKRITAGNAAAPVEATPPPAAAPKRPSGVPKGYEGLFVDEMDEPVMTPVDAANAERAARKANEQAKWEMQYNQVAKVFHARPSRYGAGGGSAPRPRPSSHRPASKRGRDNGLDQSLYGDYGYGYGGYGYGGGGGSSSSGSDCGTSGGGSSSYDSGSSYGGGSSSYDSGSSSGGGFSSGSDGGGGGGCD